MSALVLPPGCSVRLTAIGSEAVLTLCPEGDETRFGRKGSLSGLITLDPGLTRLDRHGLELARELLAHGEAVQLQFLGGLRDGLAFKATLRMAEAVS